MKDVPVLVTYDVHTHAAHSPGEVERYLHYVLDLHDELGFKASFFFPAEAARHMKRTVQELIQRGHQVGCHGLTHRGEYYNTMAAAQQEEKLQCATKEIEDIIGQRVTFFRAPAFKISGTTLQVLERLGYDADLSINSQRLGFLSSDPWNVSWMVAPRRPYHPDRQRPWRRGGLELWEIPLSCLLLPFMMNTAVVLGLTLMKVFFRALYVESISSRGPIVFMAHPEDLCGWRRRLARPAIGWHDILPDRHRGIQFRRLLYHADPGKVARLAHSLIREIRSAACVRFLTVSQFIGELNRSQVLSP